LVSTWRNLRGGKEGLSKRLDIFLVVDLIIIQRQRMKTWVEGGGDSDHLPILLQLEKDYSKPLGPFKF